MLVLEFTFVLFIQYECLFDTNKLVVVVVVVVVVAWQVYTDAGCKRDIDDLHVKCPHGDCSWTGEVRDVKERNGL